jgi:hypothetical protein
VPPLDPFLWFEVLSNHTQLHSNFTQRSAASGFALVSAESVMAIRPAVSIEMLWKVIRIRSQSRGRKDAVRSCNGVDDPRPQKFEMLSEQTRELTALGEKMAGESAEPIARNVRQAFDKAS